MFKLLKRIGRRLGLVKAEAPAAALDDDWLGKLLKGLDARGEPIPIEWGGELTKPDFVFYIDFADRRLQLAAEHFAAVVIDALQNG